MHNLDAVSSLIVAIFFRNIDIICRKTFFFMFVLQYLKIQVIISISIFYNQHYIYFCFLLGAKLTL